MIRIRITPKTSTADHDNQITISSSSSPHQPRLFLPNVNKPSTERTCCKRRGWLAFRKTLQVVYKCWLEVTKEGRYWDKWLSNETCFWALKAQFPTLDTVDFTRAIMNRAISKGGGMVLDDSVTQIQLPYFGVKQPASVPWHIRRETFGDTLLQLQE